MNDEKITGATAWWGDKKIATLSGDGMRSTFFNIGEIGFVDFSGLDNGYVIDTHRRTHKTGDDEERPYVTRAKHKEKTHGEWVTIARAPSYIGARVAHRIWKYALGSNDELIDAYIVGQLAAESEGES